MQSAARGMLSTAVVALCAAQAFAQQSTCDQVAVWSACDVTFDLRAQENTPQATLRAEFRSPKFKTLLVNAFHDGSKMVLRVAPNEPGAWTYRVTSSVARLDGQSGQFGAASSDAAGFVITANVHHFATQQVPGSDAKKPHLWMGAAVPKFAAMPRADFDGVIDRDARDHFTHLQVTIDPDTNLNEAAERIRAINAKGLVAGVALSSLPGEMNERQRYLTDFVERFDAFNITWAGLANFENVPHGRALLKEMGDAIKKLDPYAHPRWTLAASTSSPVASDGWANVLDYGTVSPEIGGTEHQFYGMPALNSGIQSRADLWNATMNGQYPTATPASGDGPYMKAWAEFIGASRYWELEPYFDVEGGRAVALEGVEYIVYVEKPGTVTMTVESHNYDVLWMNPATGETVKGKENKEKDDKGKAKKAKKTPIGDSMDHENPTEMFMIDPPDSSHDWVLRVSREGHKEGMLKSYKFESAPVVMQVAEVAPTKIPFEIAAPEGEEISLSMPAKFAIHLKRDNKATRSTFFEWTLEQPGGSEGFRVVGTGAGGTFTIPQNILDKTTGVVSLRVNAVNGLGKAYTLDKVYRLIP
jgi:hypothetical protein